MMQALQNVFLVVLQMDEIRPAGQLCQASREFPGNFARRPCMKYGVTEQRGISPEQSNSFLHGKKGIARRAEIVRFVLLHRQNDITTVSPVLEGIGKKVDVYAGTTAIQTVIDKNDIHASPALAHDNSSRNRRNSSFCLP